MVSSYKESVTSLAKSRKSGSPVSKNDCLVSLALSYYRRLKPGHMTVVAFIAVKFELITFIG
jgi:hypothetical protein